MESVEGLILNERNHLRDLEGFLTRCGMEVGATTQTP